MKWTQSILGEEVLLRPRLGLPRDGAPRRVFWPDLRPGERRPAHGATAIAVAIHNPAGNVGARVGLIRRHRSQNQCITSSSPSHPVTPISESSVSARTQAMADDGASPEEQLLFAARTDNLELFQSLVEATSQKVDVNITDSFGLTPLHLAVKYQSTDVLPDLLEEEVDVDPQERQDGDTPLHLAARIHAADDEETRNWIVEQLLEAGADARVRNNHGEKPVDVLVGAARDTPAGQELYRLLRQSEAQSGLAQRGDIAHDDDDDDDDDGPPSDDE
ncbi:unnamed protein product [Parajaminaea phylloscopi]